MKKEFIQLNFSIAFGNDIKHNVIIFYIITLYSGLKKLLIKADTSSAKVFEKSRTGNMPQRTKRLG